MRVEWLPRWKKLEVVGPQELFMFPRCFIFEVIIPLDLVEASSLVGREPWWDMPCMSNPVPTGWCLR
jgi:hypothetical protein